MTQSKCPVSKLLKRLVHFAGLPVPVIFRWVDGKPDFRQIDSVKWFDVVSRRACGVCGEKLGDTCWYIGGPKSARRELFTDPPMHGACARESLRLCPFLNGERQHYRGDVPDDGLVDTSRRPEKVFLLRGLTRNMKVAVMGETAVALSSGPIEVVDAI
jgi:hypothetical protein